MRLHQLQDGRPFVVSAICMTLGASIAGCGMSGDDPLTKPEFVEQANAICRSTNEELEPIFEKIYADFDDVDPEDPANEFLLFERWDDALVEARPVIERQLDDLAELEPPTDDEEFIDRLLTDQDAAVERFVTLVGAAADGDRDALEALDSDDDPFAEIDARAREYGLTVCGESD
jgi:hypothetical protein